MIGATGSAGGIQNGTICLGPKRWPCAIVRQLFQIRRSGDQGSNLLMRLTESGSKKHRLPTQMDNLTRQIGTTLEAGTRGVMKGDMDCILGGKDPLQQLLFIHLQRLGHLPNIPFALG